METKYFFITILNSLCIINSYAQDDVKSIKDYQDQIEMLTDSIKFYEKLWSEGSIGESLYHYKINNFYNDISSYASLIYNETYYAVDSAYNAESQILEQANEDNMYPPTEGNFTEDSIPTEPDWKMPEKKTNKAKDLALMAIMGTDFKRTSWNLVLGLGFSHLIQPEIGNSSINPNLNFIQSFLFPSEYGLLFRTRLGSQKSALGISYGFFVNSFKLGQTSRIAFLERRDDDFSHFIQADSLAELSKIKGKYLKIPIGLDLRLNKIWLSFSPYIGILIGSQQSLSYDRDLRQSNVSYSNFIGLQRFLYGSEFLIGYKKLGFVTQYNFSPLLAGKNSKEYHLIQFGLRARI